MPKSTDIRIEEVSFDYEDFRHRAPIKFGGTAVDRVTLLNVRCVVRTVGGKDYQGTGMWTEEFFIEKDTKHQAEAWDFLQWVTGPDLVGWATKEGHIVPGRTDVANSPTFLQAFPQPKNIAAFLKAADLAVPTSVHPESPKLGKAIGDGVGLFLANPQKASAAEALQQTNQQIQQILDAFNASHPS